MSRQNWLVVALVLDILLLGLVAFAIGQAVSSKPVEEQSVSYYIAPDSCGLTVVICEGEK